MGETKNNFAKSLESRLSPRDLGLLNRAVDTLMGNVWDGDAPWYPFRCITPFREEKRCGIWNWDSAFHAITVARWDPALAQECLEGFMNFQLPNGMFPDVIWQNGNREKRFGKPPVLATACEQVYQKSGDKLFLKRAYTRLLHYEKFMITHRKFMGLFHYDAENLPEEHYDLFVRYESGWDNSVRWDDPCVNYWPIDLNCFMVLTYRSLQFMVQELHDFHAVQEFSEKEAALTRFINERLWHESLKSYVDVNRFNQKKSNVLTPAAFMPLYIQIAPKGFANEMNVHAQNNREFYPGMPSVAYSDPAYSKEYWRGPTWLNVAYFAAKGLKNYGFSVAEDIKEKILSMADQNKDAIYENYDSVTGKGLHAKNFAWSACFILEFMLAW